MKGHTEGTSVLFEDEADLGEGDGGVYKWTGKIEGESFNGNYVSTTGKKGSFSMTRR